MIQVRLVAFLVLVSVLLVAPSASAQEEEVDGSLLLIMDASGSMQQENPDRETRLDEAKSALRTLVSELPDDAQVGFRVYGHRVPQSDKAGSCRDTELVVPIGPLNQDAMYSAINRYDAKGYTPIGYSLQQGAEDLPTEGKRTIVLVSDGEDTCGNPPPCEAAKEIEAQGVDLTVETVGFRTNDKARDQLQCIAQTTGGEYRDAANTEELANSLVQLSTRAVRTANIEGEPVQGAGAADDSPILEPGTYTDSILTSETLWYAVELQEGQELQARATLAGIPGGANEDEDVTSSVDDEYVEMSMYNPLNEEILDPSPADQCCAGESAVSIANSTGTVEPDEIYANEAGNYYVQITLDDRLNDNQGASEFPLELEFEVTEQAPEETTIEQTTVEQTSMEPTTRQPSQSNTPAAQPGQDQPPTQPQQGSSLPTIFLLAAIAILTLLVVALGAALIIVLIVRRR